MQRRARRVVLPLDPAAIPLAAFQLERRLKQVRKQPQGPVECHTRPPSVGSCKRSRPEAIHRVVVRIDPTQGERQLPVDQLQRHQSTTAPSRIKIGRLSLQPVTMSMATRQEKLCQTLNQPWLVMQQNQAGSSLNDAMGRPISLAPDRYICSNQQLEQS